MARRNSAAPTIRIAGTLAQGAPITPANDAVSIPRDVIALGETVYRVASSLEDLGIREGDLLILEERTHAATGELVLATSDERAFVGRWWTKHGRRALLDHEFHTLIEGRDVRILGAVTLVLRDETR